MYPVKKISGFLGVKGAETLKLFSSGYMVGNENRVEVFYKKQPLSLSLFSSGLAEYCRIEAVSRILISEIN